MITMLKGIINIVASIWGKYDPGRDGCQEIEKRLTKHPCEATLLFMSSVSDANTATIGIKIANGTYYPVMQEGEQSKKRLVLTTVKENQASVQIDLYKGRGDEIEDAVYIGSLVIEDIPPASSGDPEIELVLHIDGEGNLTATAGDSSTGETQSLSVSLESLDDMGIYDIPEFELGNEFSPEPGISPEEESQLNEEYAPRDVGRDVAATSGRRNPLQFILFLLLGIAVVVLLAWLLLRVVGGDDVPPLQAEAGSGAQVTEAPAQPAPQPAPEVKPEPPKPVAQAEPAKPEPPKPAPEPPKAAPPAAPAPIAAGDGVWYQLKYGDTLWDLSSSFYRDPFRYGQIAVENGIANPDVIFAGRDIYIPEPRR